MDSRIDTYEHITEVAKLLNKVIVELQQRQLNHDKSKLESPEVEILNEETPKLRGLTYGSEEYKENLKKLDPYLEHHFANNRHHPEHHIYGINSMTLVDLLEMICDWMAATKRHADGNIRRSIEINQARFGYTDEIKKILLNTVASL